MKEIALLLYGTFLIGGTSYIVFWKGQSGWWFLLTILFLSGPSITKGD